MASYIASLKDDLANGFSKRELEVLIGLPKNSLASILTGKRNLSVKSQLKIKRWEASEKPNPLEIDFKNAVVQMGLAKYKLNYKGEASGVRIDIDDLKEVPEQKATPIYENDAIRNEIKAIRAEKIPDYRNTVTGRKVWNLEQNNRIKELEAKLK